MALHNALTITVLGMGMVFLGLVLTSLLILSFGWIGRVCRSSRARAERVHEGAAAPVSLPSTTIMAVITTVLEAERRLYQPGQGRLTIAHCDPAAGRQDD